MPYLGKAEYQKPFYLINKHLETIVPSALRKVDRPPYIRERIDTNDQDFLDLDWLRHENNQKLVVITHGLEGSSDRPYVTGAASLFYKKGYDVLAWNCRSCSGEMNQTSKLYHHGATEDLMQVLEHALRKYQYTDIALVGFSMGGSMSLKLLGEFNSDLPNAIKGGAVFSVPCHLGDSARALKSPQNYIYKKRFLNKLKRKLYLKSELIKEIVDLNRLTSITDFKEFDDHFTAPLAGFRDGDDFYEKAACMPHLSKINRPILLVNAWNDPMLPESCFPVSIAKSHDHLHFETTEKGGHVGFMLPKSTHTWAEHRALTFIEQQVFHTDR
ncbi:MAG: alpha/beta fold hydrolase [Cyclobacteriaceae bacterium]|nr:alpha/beta fold hydrolase [Cyclobacteriaceae bacterium]MCH8515210.1 alpha/beta fold hydrolase [Cyclobacteriaceae bacterium]